MVMEYIDGMHIEKKLASLGVTERVDILTQFFGILAEAHNRGIVNRDVDLKHLFWRRDKRELIVIDWGNAKLGVDTFDETQFSFDLARAAEIIFSLVTLQGQPPPTGSIALPGDSELIPGLPPLPLEFYDLCEWAPRTPIDKSPAPYTARFLFEIFQQWREEFNNGGIRSQPNRQKKRRFICNL